MYTCVVCGHEGLEYPQYTDDGGPMFNICPCCGFQSGYHDLDREITIEDYRKMWIEGGALWKHQPEPQDWNKEIQLRRITDKK
ncbi:hypothetical protein AC624_12530 [Bacillus sp. FJAT-27238]|nr:hypothetical protein AC624_12530 [Bacillus sp. FJAT-27238]